MKNHFIFLKKNGLINYLFHKIEVQSGWTWTTAFFKTNLKHPVQTQKWNDTKQNEIIRLHLAVTQVAVFALYTIQYSYIFFLEHLTVIEFRRATYCNIDILLHIARMHFFRSVFNHVVARWRLSWKSGKINSRFLAVSAKLKNRV